MRTLLDQALDAVRGLPQDAQDHIARVMLALANHEEEPEPIDPEHLPAVLNGLAQMERGELATSAQIEAAFKRFGP
jgi:hypothetical protein